MPVVAAERRAVEPVRAASDGMSRDGPVGVPPPQVYEDDLVAQACEICECSLVQPVPASFCTPSRPPGSPRSVPVRKCGAVAEPQQPGERHRVAVGDFQD
jgi:hypothetical protein